MRIVSLCPSLTELVARLGSGSELVGVTKFCVHPFELVARIEKVGGTKDPRVERIVELAPDLVLLNREENRSEDARALAERGLRLHTSLPRDPAGARALVLDLGAALLRLDAARAIADEIDAALTRVDARRAAAQVSFLYLVWRKPWMVADRGTYVSALLERAGGINLASSDAGLYPTLVPADFACLAPQRVLLASEPFPFAAKHADELAQATGLPHAAFVLVDGEALSWHGSRTALGLDEAARVLA